MSTEKSKAKRDSLRLMRDAGIAIGPILFIIAVLGILASAIAAGSGSFTASTTSESNKSKASALIDIGQSLRLGMDRIQANGIGINTVGLINTTATTDLFSPTGGGISKPATTMAKDAPNDDWMYPLIEIPDIGTDAGSRVAILPVDGTVCDAVNQMSKGINTPGGAELGDFTAAGPIDATTNWPGVLDGVQVGCVLNTTPDPDVYYFYQVIGVQ